MYLTARYKFNLSPTEFWDMTLPEYFTELEFHAPDETEKRYAGKLTEEDVNELRDYMRGAS